MLAMKCPEHREGRSLVQGHTVSVLVRVFQRNRINRGCILRN